MMTWTVAVQGLLELSLGDDAAALANVEPLLPMVQLMPRYTELIGAGFVPDAVEAMVNELIPLEDLQARYTKGIRITVDEQEHGEKALERLREIVRGYPGKCELQLALQLADGCKVYCRCDEVRVELKG